jgi:hypothetical protein
MYTGVYVWSSAIAFEVWSKFFSIYVLIIKSCCLAGNKKVRLPLFLSFRTNSGNDGSMEYGSMDRNGPLELDLATNSLGRTPKADKALFWFWVQLGVSAFFLHITSILLSHDLRGTWLALTNVSTPTVEQKTRSKVVNWCLSEKVGAACL